MGNENSQMEKKKQQKKRKARDESNPKAPPTAYQLFCRENRERHKEIAKSQPAPLDAAGRPLSSMLQTNKVASQIWKALSQAEQRKWYDLAAPARAQFKAEQGLAREKLSFFWNQRRAPFFRCRISQQQEAQEDTREACSSQGQAAAAGTGVSARRLQHLHAALRVAPPRGRALRAVQALLLHAVQEQAPAPHAVPAVPGGGQVPSAHGQACHARPPASSCRCCPCASRRGSSR